MKEYRAAGREKNRNEFECWNVQTDHRGVYSSEWWLMNKQLTSSWKVQSLAVSVIAHISNNHLAITHNNFS